MGLQGILELVIFIDKFKNIDLFHQGFYQLRLEVYQLVNGKEKRQGVPYNHIQLSDSRCRPMTPHEKAGKSLVPPHTLDFAQKYVCQTFLIRFQEE